MDLTHLGYTNGNMRDTDMINVDGLLDSVDESAHFPTLLELSQTVNEIRIQGVAQVSTAGFSEAGAPIDLVRFGSGAFKVLIVASPHCNEPIGLLTAQNLLRVMIKRPSVLAGSLIEWNVIPCIDPDGVALNREWIAKGFSFRDYLHGMFRQELIDQPECSFPISYKRLVFDRPTAEAQVLRNVIDQVLPDFYFSLHNAWSGGAFYQTTRDLGHKVYDRLHSLLHELDIPISPAAGLYATAVDPIATIAGWYDKLEKTSDQPEQALQSGACSWEYLSEIKPEAVTFLAELPLASHENEACDENTGESRRKLMLELDASNKYLMTLILESWDALEPQLDTKSPFFRKVVHGIISNRDTLIDGLPSWVNKTRDILFNPQCGGEMTVAERLTVWQNGRFDVLCQSYAYVRLLKSLRGSSEALQHISTLERAFDEALATFEAAVDAEGFRTLDCQSLSKAQLGSGCIAINAVLAGCRA